MPEKSARFTNKRTNTLNVKSFWVIFKGKQGSILNLQFSAKV